MKKEYEYKDLLDYYWKYFELQATQRNQIIGLYYTLMIALVGGFITVAKLQSVWAKDIVLVSIIFVSIAFGVMFMRTTRLRKRARELFEKLEERCEIEEDLRLISILEGTSSKGYKFFTHTFVQMSQFMLIGIVAFITLIGVHTGTLIFDVQP